jgi:predicted pyridoxine 5'-phosphate oxidase superfamily flavin-nucleotide-binding protein
MGVVDRMDKRGPQVIRDHLTAQQREFFAGLPYVVLGSVDPEGQPWATLRDGDVGFMRVENERLLHIGVNNRPLDPAQSGMSDGCAIGTLGIQLETRRRNRANGKVSHMTRDGFDIQIEHSFGNCAQYIWMRHRQPDPATEMPVVEQVEISDALDIGHITTIREADTFFVASYVDRDDGTKQVDVSHRGGHAGFVEVSKGCLTIPDYAGNKFFNTLGNILLNSKAGLTFPDFSDGTLLQMTGDAEVIFDSERITDIPGAERLWRFRPRRVVRRSSAFALRWILTAASAPALPERAIA